MLPEQFAAQGYAADLMLTLLRLSLLPCLEQTAIQLAPWYTHRPGAEATVPPVEPGRCWLSNALWSSGAICVVASARVPWEVDPLLCPFCGNRDHLLLGYLQVEGEEYKQRLATCDACHGYVKLRSTLVPLTTRSSWWRK